MNSYLTDDYRPKAGFSFDLHTWCFLCVPVMAAMRHTIRQQQQTTAATVSQCDDTSAWDSLFTIIVEFIGKESNSLLIELALQVPLMYWSMMC